MKSFGRIGALALAIAAGGCDVTVNNKSIDNHVDAATSGLENFADSAGNRIDEASDAIENHAEALGNRVERLDDNVHVDVDLGRDDKAANAH